MSDETRAAKCDGSRDPRQRCGLHHATGLAWICGGPECCCGDSWLGDRNICSSGAEPGTPVSLRDRLDSLISWADTADERMAVADFVFAQLPPGGQGRWRQGTKNPRNLYVHQGDDQTGQPVGQLYSAELATLVCDAVNAVARVRALHVNEHGSCSACMDVCSVTWPCPTITALDRDDLPAVREFAARLDPRTETP